MNKNIIAKGKAKEVVWVYGLAAAGKETLIRKLVDGPPMNLLNDFGWEDKKIVVCQKSLMYIGQYEDDPIVEKREGILTTVPKLIKEADVVLIKGQDVDFDVQRPQRLQGFLNGVTHKILYIDIDPVEAFKRWKNKSWWDGTETYDQAVRECAEQIENLSGLKGFEVLTICDGKDKDFKKIHATAPS